MSASAFTITVYPSEAEAEYLSVADAMRQVLDLIEAMERSEASVVNERKIVWRLTEAHTNSPPFTLTAEPYPVNPAVAVSFLASRVSSRFAAGFEELLLGRCPPWVDDQIASPLKRVFQRNTNGIGRTDLSIGEEPPMMVVPATASTALVAIDRAFLDAFDEELDQRRTEYGSLEVEIYGVARWNHKPALTVIERLSGDRLTCVLSQELADRLGPSHDWRDAWKGERLLISGALHFGSDGSLRRIDAEEADELRWTDVSLEDLQGIDLLDGRTVEEHLERVRGEELG